MATDPTWQQPTLGNSHHKATLYMTMATDTAWQQPTQGNAVHNNGNRHHMAAANT